MKKIIFVLLALAPALSHAENVWNPDDIDLGLPAGWQQENAKFFKKEVAATWGAEKANSLTRLEYVSSGFSLNEEELYYGPDFACAKFWGLIEEEFLSCAELNVSKLGTVQATLKLKAKMQHRILQETLAEFKKKMSSEPHIIKSFTSARFKSARTGDAYVPLSEEIKRITYHNRYWPVLVIGPTYTCEVSVQLPPDTAYIEEIIGCSLNK